MELVQDQIRAAAPTLPRLLNTREVADLLRVTQRTVKNWIDREQIPYLELPGGQYRIPLQGLLTSLSGNYELNAELAEGENLAEDLRSIRKVAAGGEPIDDVGIEEGPDEEEEAGGEEVAGA